MLDLTALEALFQSLAYLDAKPPGERCLYSNLRDASFEKKHRAREEIEENRKVRDC